MQQERGATAVLSRLLRSITTAVENVRKTPPRDLARGIVAVVGRHLTLIFSMLLAAVWSRSAPAVDALPASAQAVYSAASTVGLISLVVLMLWDSVAVMNGTDLGVVVAKLFERLALLAVSLVAIRACGAQITDMLAWVKANPDAALAGFTGIAVVRIMFWLAPRRSFITARESEHAYGVAASVIARWPRKPQDIHRTAVHEAGHLMVYAILPELPDDLSVTVLPEVGFQDEYRGFVRHTKEWPDVTTEGHMRWNMLTTLAGAEAEFAVFGERADGSCGDNKHWLATANRYLKSGFGEVFYADASEDAHIAHNRAVLNSLKAEQVQRLGALFAANKNVLEELARAIAEAKSMSRTELAPYLARVVFEASWLRIDHAATQFDGQTALQDALDTAFQTEGEQTA